MTNRGENEGEPGKIYVLQRKNILGFIVSKDGTKSDPEKVKVIQEWNPEHKSVYSV